METTLTQALTRLEYLNRRMTDLVKERKQAKSKILQAKLDKSIEYLRGEIDDKVEQVITWGKGTILVATFILTFKETKKKVKIREQFINTFPQEVEKILKMRHLHNKGSKFEDLEILEIKETPTFYIESPL